MWLDDHCGQKMYWFPRLVFGVSTCFVATVFCTCHFFALLSYGYKLFGKEAFMAVMTPLFPFATLGLFFNHGVNFFIYVLVSASVILNEPYTLNYNVLDLLVSHLFVLPRR